MISKVLFYESTVKSIPTYEISDPPTQLRRRIRVNKFSNENRSGRFLGTRNGFQNFFANIWNLHKKSILKRIVFFKIQFRSWLMSHRLIFNYFNIISHAWVKPIQYAYISAQNSMIYSYQAKFLWSAHANFFKPIFLENAWVKLKFWLQIRNQRKILRQMISLDCFLSNFIWIFPTSVKTFQLKKIFPT